MYIFFAGVPVWFHMVPLQISMPDTALTITVTVDLRGLFVVGLMNNVVLLIRVAEKHIFKGF